MYAGIFHAGTVRGIVKSMKAKRLIVGNWKMYVSSSEEARTIASALRRKEKTWSGVEVWIAPPAPMIPILAAVLKQSAVRIGAQTVSQFDGGVSTDLNARAHTGEVSAAMLKDAGATFAVVGHSERRSPPAGGGDSDAIVAEQLKNALSAGMQAILCIGESVRDEHGGYFEFLSSQLRSAFHGIPLPLLSKLVIAYEPVWAIGEAAAGAARPEVVRETVIFIRKTLSDLMDRSAALRVPILYGGSVDGANAPALLASGEVAGFLVGRASTTAESFLAMIEACNDPLAAKVSIGTSKKKRTKKVTNQKVKRKNVKLKNQSVKLQLKVSKFRSRRMK